MNTDYDMTREIIWKATQKLNEELEEEGIQVINNWKHMISRAKERDITNFDISRLLNSFTNEHLFEFISMATLPYKNRPFRIEIRNDHVIIMLSRMDDFKWKLNTILDPQIHSKHRDKNGTFYGYINCK